METASPSSCSNENASGSESLLLSLPAEIREEVYKHLFHVEHNQPCNVDLVGLGNTGCWCADGLSLTNRQLYDELRPRFYEGVRFVFNNPMWGERFFHRFRLMAEWVISLKVTYENDVVQSHLLRDIFNYLSNSKLRNLELEVLSYDSEVWPDPHIRPRPLYLPSSAGTKEFAAIKYDLLWRPLRHSLNRLDSIKSLTVVGFPEGDTEEAIFNLSIGMQARAHQEGKGIKKTETTCLGSRGVAEWLYKIEILPEKKDDQPVL
jgi:hypothetical protein